MKSAFLFLFLVSEFFCFGQTIRGKVVDMDTKRPLTGTSVYLVNPKETQDTVNVCYWEIYKYKIISETKTDSLGRFIFSSLPSRIYSVIVIYPMPPLKELDGAYGVRDEIDSNILITPKVHHYKTFRLMVTCPYDKTRNQLFCPKCKRKDKVKPILFGLPALSDEPGFFDKYYFWGCFVDSYCLPTNHCCRCNKDF